MAFFHIFFLIFLYIDNDDENVCPSRKRKRNPKLHKEFLRKRKVQRGEEHYSASGKIIKRKQFCGQIKCVCKKNCADKIDILRQKELFDAFYAMKNWTEKTLFLRSFATRSPTRKSLDPIKNIQKREFQSKLFLTDSEEIKHQVCFKFLQNALQISNKRMFRCIESEERNPNAIDFRGKFPSRKTNPDDIDFAKSVIKKLVTYETKYKMCASSPKHVHPNLNLKDVYEIYRKQCRLSEKHEISMNTFRRVLGMFNLKFRKRVVGSCQLCKAIENQMQPQVLSQERKQDLSKMKTNHLKNAEIARDKFLNTIERSLDIENFSEVYTFSMQRSLEVPSLNCTDDVYFKRQLWVFNFCLYDEIRQKAYIYTWDETVAATGSQEIVSCIYRHINENVSKETSRIILYSAPSFGQNRNIEFALMLKWVLYNSNLTKLNRIEQRFFIRGHTRNSCDRCFNIIEDAKNKSKQNVFTPNEWFKLIEEAKNTHPKFQVIEMEYKHFYSSMALERFILSWKMSIGEKKIKWHKFQTIIYDKAEENPFKFSKIESFMNSEMVSSFELKSKPMSMILFPSTRLNLLYPNGRDISQEKYLDLQSLLQYIPAKYHKFYQELKYSDQSKKDYAVASRQSSDDEEEDDGNDNE